jgi:hypothetical protein
MASRHRGLGLLDVTKPLRKALAQLQAERQRIDRQISGIERALSVLADEPSADGRRVALRPAPRRPKMSVKARKALSQRMKAYWAKRRQEAAKAKEKGGK